MFRSSTFSLSSSSHLLYCNEVLTSLRACSRHPDELYKNGIQRSSFLPAIDLLKSQFDVTDLDSGTGSLSATTSIVILTSLIR